MDLLNVTFFDTLNVKLVYSSLGVQSIIIGMDDKLG